MPAGHYLDRLRATEYAPDGERLKDMLRHTLTPGDPSRHALAQKMALAYTYMPGATRVPSLKFALADRGTAALVEDTMEMMQSSAYDRVRAVDFSIPSMLNATKSVMWDVVSASKPNFETPIAAFERTITSSIQVSLEQGNVLKQATLRRVTSACSLLLDTTQYRGTISAWRYWKFPFPGALRTIRDAIARATNYARNQVLDFVRAGLWVSVNAATSLLRLLALPLASVLAIVVASKLLPYLYCIVRKSLTQPARSGEEASRLCEKARVEQSRLREETS